MNALLIRCRYLTGAILLGLGMVLSGCFSISNSRRMARTQEPVGQLGTNRYYTPANQILTPVGRQVELPGLRPQALALSPDGTLLVTSGKTAELIVMDPVTGAIRQRVPLPSEENGDPAPAGVSGNLLKPDRNGQLSYTGLVFSPDGSRLYMANVNGSIKVFGVTPDHRVVGRRRIRLPLTKAWKRVADIPSGLAVSADGRRLYVVLNLSNQLLELEVATGTVRRRWAVGVAPYDVVLAGAKAYVSNWGGRRPGPGDVTGPAGRGKRVRVDPVRHIANDGSVSVINLDRPLDPSAIGNPQSTILTGLHPCAMALSPEGRYLVVANAASDTLHVIDTRTDQILETIWARQSPADLFGATPNALAFDDSGKTLFVGNATQNAVAVIAFDPGESKMQGLIPVGWFPGAIVHDAARRVLYVANIKGIGSTRRYGPGEKVKFNSRQYFGTVSLLRVPTQRELAAYTRVALRNMRYPLLAQARRPARRRQPPRPVPERVGEPSVFRHVVYMIKENRTYDQVLGDLPEGNGDPELCIYGQQVTPNQHKLAREFVLLDNTYCSGILSADGHQWTDSAITTDYMERSFAGFPRSYPDGMEDSDVDALAYAPTGFIWDNVIAHGKSLRIYGEFAITDKAWRDPARPGKPSWTDHFREYLEGANTIALSSRPAIESIRPYLCTNTVGWDMDVTDIFRAGEFIKELKQYEAEGAFPNLAIICLPNDHTSGTKVGAPTPAAQVADNDLALGRIVAALSHSRFWSNTCVIAIEDDPQNGWDHVSGYRTTCYVVSPYTRRGEVVSTQYNQTSILRTIELMLGLPPMNQMDATATPLTDCFVETPDFTPFQSVDSNIPLNQMNPDPKQISDPLLRRHAQASARLPLDRVDACPEDLFNRILWHAAKGPQASYPEWAVKSVAEED